MSRQQFFSKVSLKNMLSGDNSILDNARIRLIYSVLIFSFFILAALLINVRLQHLYLLTATNTILLVSAILLFTALTYNYNWRTIAHVVLIVGTLINLFDVYISLQKVGAITIEVIIMVMLFSFYILGKKWGLLYCALNAVPVAIFMMLQYNGSYTIDLKPEKTSQSTDIFCVFAGFALITFIHGQFYMALIKKTKQLKQNADEQKALNQKYLVAMENAQKLSEAKSEFLSSMSHEIRTPLNAVIGMSNLLLMNGPKADQKENLEVLRSSAGNLLSIVNDVLDFNKIESGRLIFENTRFNLDELMHNICGGQMIAAQQKGLLFDLVVDPGLNKETLFGDTTRITQVILNLVSNAIKFTSSGYVLVKATCVESYSNSVTVNFSVKDTGIGIAKEKLDKIFEPFKQSSISLTRQYGGTGLGLAIVKRLLELQDIQIQVASKPGQGSEFSFDMEFPVYFKKTQDTPDNSIQQPPAIPESSDNLGLLQVLIAEDNPVNVMLMKKLLAKWGISPAIANDGERAIEMVNYGNFDIILMDLQMPIMNGFDATVQIRKMPDRRKANIPIIALTASALHDIKERVFESGMNEYVAKPFKPNELLEKIQHLTMGVL